MENSAINKILEEKCLVLFYHEDFDTCRRIIDAVAAGGINTVEIVNRGSAALDNFHLLVNEYRESSIYLGAGTITRVEQAQQFADAGAWFIVSPFTDSEMVSFCIKRELPVIPGCGTVTEIHQAEKLGATIFKVFPASAAGGPGFIKAVLGPLPGTKMIPTGGVTAEPSNIRSWFDAGAAAVGFGSQLVRKDLVETGDFDLITKEVAGAVEVISQYR